MGKKRNNQHPKKKIKISKESPPTEISNITPLEEGPIPKTISQRIWSWGVVGAIILTICVGGGFAFMTTAHTNIADLFFLMGGILFLCKFLTWEPSRKHGKRKLIESTTILITLLLIVGAIFGNHYLNQIKPNSTIVLPQKETAKTEYASIDKAIKSIQENLSLNFKNLEKRLLEKLRIKATAEKSILEKKYPLGYFLFASDKQTNFIPLNKEAKPDFSFDWENCHIASINNSIVDIALKSFHYYPNDIQLKNIDVILERKIGAVANGIFFNNIGLFVEMIDDQAGDIIYAVGFRKLKSIPKVYGVDFNTKKHIIFQDITISSVALK